jgi:hypothetical protein
MPEVPVGDILRSVVKKGWLRKILDLLKGVKITKGGTTIVLDERPTVGGRSSLDQPHKPGPVR